MRTNCKIASCIFVATKDKKPLQGERRNLREEDIRGKNFPLVIRESGGRTIGKIFPYANSILLHFRNYVLSELYIIIISDPEEASLFKCWGSPLHRRHGHGHEREALEALSLPDGATVRPELIKRPQPTGTACSGFIYSPFRGIYNTLRLNQSG